MKHGQLLSSFSKAQQAARRTAARLLEENTRTAAGKETISRMFKGSDLFLLGCLCLTVDSQTGQILPPQHLFLLWRDDFNPVLTWAPPQLSVSNCSYQVTTQTKEMYSKAYYENQSLSWTDDIVMEGGYLHLSVKTKCNGTESVPTVLVVDYKEMVKSLQCLVHSSNHAHCSWEPTSLGPVLSFFYQLVVDRVDNHMSPLQECSSYTHTKDIRTGCDLHIQDVDAIRILFNGTVNNTLFRNTFRKELADNVRPPPLEWTVVKAGDKFNISWTPPDLRNVNWDFIINYTECNKESVKSIPGATSTHLNVIPHCQYRMVMKAKSNNGETPWSDEKYFDAEVDPNAMVYAAIIIPLMFAGLAVLMIVCCRKNKEHIFPKVPQPRDLLSDISDNNNKSTVCDLYIPAEEEENCKIILVKDPQISKLDY
ncbi:interleukin-13 receptor subunit alpha-1 [Trachinotus anak]|uniref:interleukin-13 receptor subunit alpha-1 n=1 Tax=Trachinotus anak TaxID=443729 RepID=UPI0039F254C2